MATEELSARNGQDLEIIYIGSLNIIRGVQGGVSLYYDGNIIGAISVNWA